MTTSFITNKDNLIHIYNGVIISSECGASRGAVPKIVGELPTVLNSGTVVEEFGLLSNDYVNSLHSYFINPDRLVDRREHMESKLISNFTRIVPDDIFLSSSSDDEKYTMISNSHIKCWEAALNDNRDGAFFFEDDVYFLKNWREIVGNIFEKRERNNINIIRLDPIPFIRATDLQENECISFNSITAACMGGYYMSRTAIVQSLNVVNKKEYNINQPEYLLKYISRTYFINTSYETIPRICIQNWFLNNESTLQHDDHMIGLRNAMIPYMKQYKYRYDLNETELIMVEENIRQYNNLVVEEIL